MRQRERTIYPVDQYLLNYLIDVNLDNEASTLLNHSTRESNTRNKSKSTITHRTRSNVTVSYTCFSNSVNVVKIVQKHIDESSYTLNLCNKPIVVYLTIVSYC